MDNKHELILGCMRWAESLASQEHRRTGMPLEDLRSAAYEGLCQAAESFDLDRGTSFLTWSKYHVRNRFGHLRRSLRQATGYRPWHDVADDEIPEEDRPLVAALQEGLTQEQAAAKVGITTRSAIWRVDKIRGCRVKGRVSLDLWLDRDGTPIPPTAWEEEDRYAKRQLIAAMLRELREMPQESQDVIRDVVWREMLFREIAPRIGVTKQGAHLRYSRAIKELQRRCKRYC